MTRIVPCICRGSVSVAQWIGAWVCPRSRLDSAEELQLLFPAKNRITTVRPVASDCNEGGGGVVEYFTKPEVHHYVHFVKHCIYLKFVS